MKRHRLTSSRLANIVAVIGVFGLIGMGIYITATNLHLSQQLNASQANAERLYEQLLEEGIEPEADPPGQVATNPQTVPGPRGTPGADGTDGEDGRTPTAAEVSGVVAAYCAANNQCLGPQGIPGAPGIGIVGPSGAAGQDGQNGQDGASVTGPPGATGETGAAGQPPASWTYTDALGLQYQCQRSDPFDAASPTYTCAATSPPPGETPVPE